MKKEKKLFSGFCINLLGVILGILLTFGVNSLYQKREEKKMIREMLTLVRNELQTNKEHFKHQERIIRKDALVYRKILEAKNKWETIDEDTLSAYYLQTMYLEFSQLTTSAWEIFRNSEIIRKMEDKELIIRLTDCYFWIDKIHDNIKTEYWDSKTRAVAPEVDKYKYFDAVMDNKETVFFYTQLIDDDFANWNMFPFIDAIIDYTIMLLDSHGYYVYEMDEKDKEIELFINSRMDSVLNKK
jgi:predicted membrane chloride channel (bestrophin family)